MSELGKPSASRGTMVTRSVALDLQVPPVFLAPIAAHSRHGSRHHRYQRLARSTERAKALASPRATTPPPRPTHGDKKFDNRPRDPPSSPPIAPEAPSEMENATCRGGDTSHRSPCGTPQGSHQARRPRAGKYSSMGRATKNKNSAMSPQNQNPLGPWTKGRAKDGQDQHHRQVYPTEQRLSDHHAIETRQHAEHTRRPSSSSWTGHAPRIEQSIQLVEAPPSHDGASLRERSILFECHLGNIGCFVITNYRAPKLCRS